jgi:hypothetical protein
MSLGRATDRAKELVQIPKVSPNPLLPELEPCAAESVRSSGNGRVRQSSSAADKISLFRSLFRGREDVYPVRFESRKTGRAGCQPACAHEGARNVCEHLFSVRVELLLAVLQSTVWFAAYLEAAGVVHNANCMVRQLQ